MNSCVDLVCWALLGLLSLSTARPALTLPEQVSLKQRSEVELYSTHPGDSLQLRCRLREDIQSIAWTKDGVQLPANNRTRITAEYLQITDSVRQDSGRYTCVASGPSGSETSHFAVNVSDAVYSVEEDDEDEDEDDDEDEDEDDDEGIKSDEKSNKEAQRSPHRPILQAGLPANKMVTVGSDVEFVCKVYSDPQPHIQWLKHVMVNGSRMGPDGSPYLQVLKATSVDTTDQEMEALYLRNVTFEDAGQYTCLAGNSIGISHHSAWLTVLQERSPHRPILQAGLPANKMVTVGSDVEFVCKVYSDPQPHIQWLKHVMVNGSRMGPDGSPYLQVLKATSVDTTDQEMEALYLRNVTFEDAGQYTCLAGNSIGISHHSAWLTVLQERSPHRPILQAGLPANKTVTVGSDVEFVCKVYSDPQPHIQWLKHVMVNDNMMRPDGSPYLQVLKATSVDTTDQEMEALYLRNVTFEDAGQYTCLAGNSIGISHHSAWLTVLQGDTRETPSSDQAEGKLDRSNISFLRSL
ncbi:fibroblast growth factor receptor 1-like isoform X2 [Amblyraja radiata]|uniref:fibroblast growth factor receptor 1-like isoform X2 n=1 Tax=Amblyraja radiata TaxID=386614 RepID=UPI00140371E1|nr:fibroblast growth factor receptor 1-like isoform X2 [Amblyraja radiata]